MRVSKVGGQWDTWHVPAEELGEPYLLIELDRSIINDDLVLDLEFIDHAGSSLVVDLLDANGDLVLTTVEGELIDGTGETVTKSVIILLADNQEVTTIRIRRITGEITLTGGMLYIDQDGDGLDAFQEAQLGTSDLNIDSDGDGIEDGVEVEQGTDPSTWTYIFHVDASNSGAEDGSASAPYNTILEAINDPNANQGVAGNPIYIRVAAGTYNAELWIEDQPYLKFEGGWVNTSGAWTRPEPLDNQLAIIGFHTEIVNSPGVSFDGLKFFSNLPIRGYDTLFNPGQGQIFFRDGSHNGSVTRNDMTVNKTTYWRNPDMIEISHCDNMLVADNMMLSQRDQMRTIASQYADNLRILRNTIWASAAVNYFNVPISEFVGAGVLIRNNVIYCIGAYGAGSQAIQVLDGAWADIVGNTIYSHTPNVSSPWSSRYSARGIMLRNISETMPTRIINNIFTMHRMHPSTKESVIWHLGGAHPTVISHNCFYGVTTGNPVLYEARDPVTLETTDISDLSIFNNSDHPLLAGIAIEGNIVADPLFADADARDYHLLPGSPCIDAADAAYVEEGEVDADGNPRIFGPAPDIGGYETVDIDADGLPDWWELQNFQTLEYGAADDPDNDGYSNLEEAGNRTDPTQSDPGNSYLDVSVDGSGTIDVEDGWYVDGTEVILAATPVDGFRFDQWSGDVPAGDAALNPLTLTMDQSRTITAAFVENLAYRLVVHYTFDQDSGGQVYDASGNGNDGYIVGGVTYEDSIEGKAPRFASRNTYIVSDAADLNMDGWDELTVSAWVLIRNYTTYGIVGGRGDVVAVGSGGFSMGVGGVYGGHWNHGTFGVSTNTSVGSRYMDWPTFAQNVTPYPEKNRWYHLTGTYAGGTLSLYEDGVLAASSTASANPLADGIDTKLVIGNAAKTPQINWYDKFFNGLIDEFRIYDRALDASDVTDLYNLHHTGGDNDGMPDDWEIANGLNPLIDDSAEDPDEDGLSNLAEYLNSTDPQQADTDGDELLDGDEVNTIGSDPLDPDSDGLNHFVSEDGDNTEPYLSWATAAAAIQDAVDEAVAGDTVFVGPGTYDTGSRVTPGYSTLNRVIIDKAITVLSTGGPDVAIIEGEPDPVSGALGDNAVRGVFMQSGTLSGFTVKNGHTRDSGALWGNEGGDALGGGVFIWSSVAVLTNCIVENNAALRGAGICSDGVVRDCLIRGNNIGGGIRVFGGIVENCRVENNTSDDGAGGVDCEPFGPVMPLIKACEIVGNASVAGWGGVLMYSGGEITDSLIAENTGGGVLVMTTGTVRRCTIVNNGEGSLDTMGLGFGSGGWAQWDPADIQIEDCIIYGNEGGNWGDIDGLGGAAIRYSCTTPMPDGPANIIDDPLFVDAVNGDYRLQSASPCMDAGSRANLPGALDLDRRQRVMGPALDMGAYEVLRHHYVSPNGSHVAPYDSWETAAYDIQSAVDVAIDGNTVFVGPGTYDTGSRVVEGFSLKNRVVIDKEITVAGLAEPWSTVIRGSQDPASLGLGDDATRGVYLSGGAVLKNIMVSGGYTRMGDDVVTWEDYLDACGGGVLARDGSRIIKCMIGQVLEGNMAGAAGGGVYMVYGVGTTVLTGSTVSGNTAQNGGGVFADGDGLIEQCRIDGNFASGRGGGIHGYGEFIVDRCTITDNVAVDPYESAGGSGVCIGYGGELRNSLIVDSVGWPVWGAAVIVDLRGVVENCTIPGGLWYYDDDQDTDEIAIRDCIIGGWSTPLGSGEQIKYSCTTPMPAGVGNITDDPLFVNPAAGDHHLQPSSPCIDTGSYIASDESDLDGGQRVIGAAVDMGAYESANGPDRYHVSNTGSDTPPYSTWATAASNIQDAIDIATEGSTVIVGDGTYTGARNRSITFGKSLVLMSLNGPVKCIIDCESADRGFSFGSDDSGVEVRGFTITRGYAAGGGGISCYAASPTIRNCRILKCISTSHGGAVRDVSANGPGIILENCVLAGNFAALTGGAVYSYDSDSTLRSCTVTKNFAAHAAGDIYSSLCSPVIQNSILWDNSAGQISMFLPSDALNITYSDVEGGYVGTGNFDLDPLLTGSYRLTQNSPCIDLGDLASAAARDMDGEQRSDPPDVGADEFIDTDGDGMSDAWEREHGTDPNKDDSDGDADGDGTDNGTEYEHGTDPNSGADGDGDGLPDAWENKYFGDLDEEPFGDADGDGESNWDELHDGEDPTTGTPIGVVIDATSETVALYMFPSIITPLPISAPAGTIIASRTFTLSAIANWDRFYLTSSPPVGAGWATSSGLRLRVAGTDIGVRVGKGIDITSLYHIGSTVTITVHLVSDGTGIISLSDPIHLLQWSPSLAVTLL